MDVLECCSHTEIRKAWSKYQRTGPRTATGKLYKPDAGAIWQIVIDGRPRPKIVHDSRAATGEENEAYLSSVARDKINPKRKAEADAIMSKFKTGARE